MSEAPGILIVCTGNLCRSPLAEVLLRRELAAEHVPAEISSAGLAAPLGASPDRRLRRVAGDLGVDVDDHRSRPASVGDLRAADLILTMTNEQTAQVLSARPVGRRSRGDAARGGVAGGRRGRPGDAVRRVGAPARRRCDRLGGGASRPRVRHP